ncbi:unnamed protein product [Parajaminaea phylloscopi]
MSSSVGNGAGHPSSHAEDGPPPPPPPATAHSNNNSIQAPGSPPAAFPDGDDINSFWPPEPRPPPPPPAASMEDSEATAGADLAIAAAKADPFGALKDMPTSSSTESPSSNASTSQAANVNRSYPPHVSAFPGSSGFTPALPVFPGQQPRNRDMGKPVSAMRTSEGSQRNGGPPAYAEEAARGSPAYEEEAAPTPDVVANQDADADAAHEEGPSARNNGVAQSAASGAGGHANYFAHAHDLHGQSSSSSSYSQRDMAHGGGPPTPGASDADTSMMSQQGAGGAQSSNHRKRKPFKYLQDEPVGQGVKPRAEKRKKVQKACRPCKRSHMPCDAQRPCPRCIKRGIPELCVDAEPITRRPSRKSALVASSVEHSEPPEDANEIEQLARAAEAMRSPGASAALLASAAAAAVTESETKAGELNGPVVAPERAFVSSLEPARAEALHEALSSASEDLIDMFGGEPLSLLADPTLPVAILDGEALPFSHTRSYSKLAKWAVSQLPPSIAAELDPVTGSARGHFLQAAQNVRLVDLQPLEEDFQNMIPASSDGQNWMDSVPVPMMFARRSGEIYAVNGSCAALLGVEPEALTTGKLNLIQLGQDRRAVEMAKLLTNSQVFCLGETVSATIFLSLSHAKSILEDYAEADQGAGTNLAEQGPERLFVVSLKTSEWRDGLPLAVTCTLTPVAVGSLRP